MSWTIQRMGPDESRYVLDETGGRFIARMDNEATDAEWYMVSAAPKLLEALQTLYKATHEWATGRASGSFQYWAGPGLAAARDAIDQATIEEEKRRGNAL